MAARAIVVPYPSFPPLANPRARIHIATPLNLKLHPSSSGLYTKWVPRKLALRPLASHVCQDGEVRPADSGDDEVDLPTEERIAETADSRGAELPIGIWQQVKDIVAFAAPAAGLWICGPMMSLIDTAVVGQSSSLELAALGLGMLFLMKFFGAQILSAFIGPKNLGIVPAANSYVQFLAAFLMVESLNRTGFNAFLFSIPSPSELLQIFELAAPVFVTMFSKVAFYSLLTYFATSMGTITLAAHQAKQLLQSLVIIGICTGLLLGTIGMMVPWLFPYLFTNDHNVVSEMQTVLLPYFVALVITPPTHSLEGTLLAGRDLKFLSLSMSSCFSFGSLLLLARFLLAGRRLTSSQSVVLSDRLSSENFSKLKAAQFKIAWNLSKKLDSCELEHRAFSFTEQECPQSSDRAGPTKCIH
ncbi:DETOXIFICATION 46 protein [Nymphaea thermarum]|nr:DETOXIFICATION 46 protein [Nymphaea thermarum]